jgi:hypothetical protein
LPGGSPASQPPESGGGGNAGGGAGGAATSGATPRVGHDVTALAADLQTPTLASGQLPGGGGGLGWILWLTLALLLAGLAAGTWFLFGHSRRAPEEESAA